MSPAHPKLPTPLRPLYQVCLEQAQRDHPTWEETALARTQAFDAAQRAANHPEVTAALEAWTVAHPSPTWEEKVAETAYKRADMIYATTIAPLLTRWVSASAHAQEEVAAQACLLLSKNKKTPSCSSRLQQALWDVHRAMQWEVALREALLSWNDTPPPSPWSSWQDKALKRAAEADVWGCLGILGSQLPAPKPSNKKTP